MGSPDSAWKFFAWGALVLGSVAVGMSVLREPAFGDQAAAQPGKPVQQLRHVVLFKFKEGTEPSKIKEVEAAFGRLPGQIDTIVDFEWGTDVSSENLSAGFTHCFCVTFADEKGRDAYLPHAAHQKFVELVKPVLDKVLVVDYVTRK